MCYSVLYFKPSTEKNDSSVVLKSLNPEGPFGSYLCDITLPTLNHVSVSFLWNKENKQEFLPDEKILVFLFFLRSIFLFPALLCSLIIPSTEDYAIFIKSIFYFL